MKFKLLAATTLTVALTLSISDVATADSGKTYKITITNLTAGQPFTPPVLLTHTRKTGIFTLGEMSSADIQAIAENGNNGPLVAALGVDVNVHDVVVGGAPIVPANNPGGTAFASSASFEIATSGKARYFSFVNMLICTNDGFTGLDSIRLPRHKKTVYSVAFDARSEVNTEAFADMVPPCQGLIGGMPPVGGTGMSNPMLAEDGIIIPHVGINGGIDLFPEVHGWSDPVARIVIERVRHYGDDD